VAAAVVIVFETAAVVLLRHVLSTECFESLYLPGVLVVSAVWGVTLATATSLASAVALAYFHNWPTVPLMPLDLDNAVVVVVFLGVALLTNLAAGTARRRSAEADRSGREVGALATQQAALRQVATLVARGAPPSQVFEVVADEMAACLDVAATAVARYDSDDTGTVVAVCNRCGRAKTCVGQRFTLEGDTVAATVLRTARPARKNDYHNLAGALGERVRAMGFRSVVAAPVIVDQDVWGVAYVLCSTSERLPPDTEECVAHFADLVATAISNAATRAALIASRARIVAAGDDARRRIERDLHDGAQQRLVSLGLRVGALENSMTAELDGYRAQLCEIVSELAAVSVELQEISGGIHPAILG